MTDFLAACIQFIGPHEGPRDADPPGAIPFMYLDTRDLVTVAIGNMLPSAEAACALPFIIRSTGQAASHADITGDWNRVKQAPPARLASWYEKLTECVLTPDDMRDLFDRRVTEFSNQLRAHFPDFDSWPQPAKIATLDWVFNAGIAKLMATEHLRPALASQNWTGAAFASHRATNTAEGEARNIATRNLYLSAMPA